MTKYLIILLTFTFHLNLYAVYQDCRENDPFNTNFEDTELCLKTETGQKELKIIIYSNYLVKNFKPLNISKFRIELLKIDEFCFKSHQNQNDTETDLTPKLLMDIQLCKLKGRNRYLDFLINLLYKSSKGNEDFKNKTQEIYKLINKID